MYVWINDKAQRHEYMPKLEYTGYWMHIYLAMYLSLKNLPPSYGIIHTDNANY